MAGLGTSLGQIQVSALNYAKVSEDSGITQISVRLRALVSAAENDYHVDNTGIATGSFRANLL